MLDSLLLTSAHLNTAIQTVDVAGWELTERTNAWINLLCLEDDSTAKLLRSERRHFQSFDREQSHYFRSRFRSLPDVCVTDLRSACDQLKAHEWPVVHYCGHSVDQRPARRPEVAASFWCNDDRYQKLVEVPVAEVGEWLRMPAVFIVECNSAQTVLDGLPEDGDGSLYLGVCGRGERLPFRGGVRKDLFGCLLTCPVKTAVELHRCKLGKKGQPLERLPGHLPNRKMLLGQLDWVLTLMLDAIGERTLPAELFERLFRGDLMVATMFRRFLLAQRTLPAYGCNPVSKPELPNCAQDGLWAVWDKLLDRAVDLLEAQDERECRLVEMFFRLVMEEDKGTYLPFIPHALTVPQQSVSALDKLSNCWPEVQADPKLQQFVFAGLMELLKSNEDPQIFAKAINSAMKLLTINSENIPSLKQLEGVNLIGKLPVEFSDDLVVKTIVLQLFAEQSSEEKDRCQLLLNSCEKLLEHSNADIRLWSILLMTKIGSNHPSLESLLTDPVPKVRTAAMTGWIAANLDKKDVLLDKIVSLIPTNSSCVVRRELVHVLNAAANQRLPELVTSCKQESIKQPEPAKSAAKAKAKSKQKKPPTAVSTTSSEAVMTRAWSCLKTLQNDPDPEVAGAVRSLVNLVRQKANANGNDAGKKAKKKLAAQEANAMLLPARESYRERCLREFLEKVAAPPQVVEEDKENHSRLANGVENSRNPTMALLNHQLRHLQTKRAPEIVRFGPQRQLAIPFKECVSWQDYDGEAVHNLKPTPSATGNGDTAHPVTSLLFQSASNLLVGHRDGVVRMWSSTDQESPTLINAWQALYDHETPTPPKPVNPVMTTIDNRKLLVGGDSKHIRCWDLNQEVLSEDLPSDHGTITAMTNHGHNLAVGTADGAVRLYDLRAPNKVATAAPKHAKPPKIISFRPNDEHTLVSVCAAGSVHVLDTRKMTPVKTWSIPELAFPEVAIHERLDLMATCSAEVVEVYTVEGKEVARVDRNDVGEGVPVVVGGAVGKKRPPTCVAFHGTELLMCVGYKDNMAVLFGEKVGGE
ncbi:regulatory-associated protein of mTOR-like [Culex pipiens pallens]|uniref:regulatory-associated protein of mTOR-like n=1 Tax=Culex pipiens pallens TaxID=42434 RepID=UPI0022AA59A3|nr:regulatory-associated protein of mTOR-like [Culex pipiens pallens]